MTGTVTRSAVANGLGPRAHSPLPTRQRRPAHVALLVALIVVLGALGGWAYSTAGKKTPVVVVARPVPAGHVIGRADVSTVAVAGEVRAIGADGIEAVVGRTAAVELLPGTLLQRAMLSSSGPLGADEGLVGVAVAPGQLPADGLAPGDRVRVVQLPAQDATSGGVAAPVDLVLSAVVFSASDAGSGNSTVVSLIVPLAKADAVAAAGAAGRVALIGVAGS
jgi:hypothetical protein